MSSHNEQLQPTPFEVAQSTEPTAAVESAARRGTAPWVLPALAGLLLLAVLVIFWLPERVAPTSPDEPVPGGVNTTQETTLTPAAPGETTNSRPDATPWSDAQAAKLRKEAQEVLAELLDIQTVLEERAVQQWAAEAFAAATAFAASGDELYRSREYEQARSQYQQGLAAMQALQESIPGEMTGQLDAATQAIENGEPEAANSALEMASLIEPENARLPPLRQRAEALPQLLALLEEAALAEQGGDLANAEQLLQQAAQLDAQHLRTGSELERVAAAYREQRFNDAMSDGYMALDEGRFDGARKAFRAAAELQSGSSEAASALQEVAAAETAYKLASLKTSGTGLERQEKWQDAVNAYEKAQKIDKNVLFASEGLKRARARARLDKQFRTALDEPRRLSDVAVADATEQLLRQAAQIKPRGPVLEQQIGRLQILLQQANTPVTVTLRSDQQTEVVVYKIARLGRFQEHELTLRPGTYTAVGSRNGYRDVRKSFTINHDGAPVPVTISCTEPI